VAKLAACRPYPCLATPFTWRSGVARIAAPSRTTGRLLVQVLTQDRRGGHGAIRNRKGTRSNRSKGERTFWKVSSPDSRHISPSPDPSDALISPSASQIRPTPSSIAVEGTARCRVTLPCIQALIFHSVRKFGIVEDGDTCPTSSCRIFFRCASLLKTTPASHSGCVALHGIVRMGVRSCNNICSIYVAPSGMIKGAIMF
jgi:hypothetical protein